MKIRKFKHNIPMEIGFAARNINPTHHTDTYDIRILVFLKCMSGLYKTYNYIGHMQLII